MQKKLLFILALLSTQHFVLAKNYQSFSTNEKGKTLVMMYIAGDNDLEKYTEVNIQQIASIGSNNNITIVVQLDKHGPHQFTKRFLIQKNAVTQVNTEDQTGLQKLNSGNPETLIDFCRWAAETYPAENYVVILWNHGSGVLDIKQSKAINPSRLFRFNPENHFLELDRSIGLFEYLESHLQFLDPKGICFSDTYGSYLTNETLEYALKKITTEVLHKKIDVLGFDACLMSMVEIADLVSPYANFMVGSQEVELATGWPYHLILKPFLQHPLKGAELAQHIVECYRKTYSKITQDFTQAAIDLSLIEELIRAIKKVNTLLLKLIKNQLNFSVQRIVKACGSRKACTHFAEPNYIDLGHFYNNLLASLDMMSVKISTIDTIDHLKDALTEAIKALEKTVIKKAAGANLSETQGLSIYFPQRRLASVYNQCLFAQKTGWIDLINALD